MAIWDPLANVVRSIVPAGQQLLRNVGFTQQQRGTQAGFLPRQFGGLVAPAYAAEAPRQGSVLGQGTGPTGIGAGTPVNLRTTMGQPPISGGPQVPQAGLPFEQAPGGEGAPSLDELVGPAIQALEEFEGVAKRQYMEVEPGAIGATEARGVREAEAEQTKAEAVGTTRRAEEGRRTESAIGEARRGFSELQQGLISRFGTAISTGLGAQSILGAEAMRNINNLRTAYTDFEGRMAQAENEVRVDVANRIQTIREQAEQSRSEARQNLMNVLAEINVRKAELKQGGAEVRLRALQDYRNTLAAVNQRNTQFEQALYTRNLEHQQALEQIKAKAANVYNIQLREVAGRTQAFRVNEQTGTVEQLPITVPAGGAVTGGRTKEEENILGTYGLPG